MKLNQEPFEAIKIGKQSIEVRLYDEKRRKVKVVDEIVFLKRPEEIEKFTVEITGLSIFKSFKDLFQAIDPEKLGYQKRINLADQLNCMKKYYSEDEEKKYGAVGIHLQTTFFRSNNLVKLILQGSVAQLVRASES